MESFELEFRKNRIDTGENPASAMNRNAMLDVSVKNHLRIENVDIQRSYKMEGHI